MIGGIQVDEQQWRGSLILANLAKARKLALPLIGAVGVEIMRVKLGSHVVTGATKASIMWATNTKKSSIQGSFEGETIEKIEAPPGVSSVLIGSAYGAGKISKPKGDQPGKRYSTITAIEYGAIGPGSRNTKPGLGFMRSSKAPLRRLGKSSVEFYAKRVIEAQK